MGADASLLLSRMADHAKVVIKAAPLSSGSVSPGPVSSGHPTLSALLGGVTGASSPDGRETAAQQPPVFELGRHGSVGGLPPCITEEEDFPGPLVVTHMPPPPQPQLPHVATTANGAAAQRDPFTALLGEAPASNGTALPPVAALVEQFGALGLPVPPTPRDMQGTPDDWAELVQWADAHVPGTPRTVPQMSLLDV